MTACAKGFDRAGAAVGGTGGQALRDATPRARGWMGRDARALLSVGGGVAAPLCTVGRGGHLLPLFPATSSRGAPGVCAPSLILQRPHLARGVPAPVVVLEVTAELALRIARRVEDAPRFAAQLEIAALTQSIDWLNRRLAVWLASLMGAVGGMAMGIVLARVIS